MSFSNVNLHNNAAKNRLISQRVIMCFEKFAVNLFPKDNHAIEEQTWPQNPSVKFFICNSKIFFLLLQAQMCVGNWVLEVNLPCRY